MRRAAPRLPFAVIDGAPYRQWWRERFDPPHDPFAGMRFYRRGVATVWVGSADVAGLASTQMDAVGLHLARVNRAVWKPTSAAIVGFADTARRNFIELDRPEMLVMLSGGTLHLGADDPRRAALSRGFVAARVCEVPIGCAEWDGDDMLTSRIPKRRWINVAEFDL